MQAIRKLRAIGQSLWLDNLTRDLLTRGTLERYIETLSISGVTSNPTIFEHAIKNSAAYDAAIRNTSRQGRSPAAIFLDLALDDIVRAADVLRPVFEHARGGDGFVSLEVSPRLAHDTAGTFAAAIDLHRRADRPNVLIKIPGTPEGLPAIEESIFAGVPINVTLLLSPEQYLASANAYLRGIERRIAAGRTPDVVSFASLFVSRWDAAVASKVPAALVNRLGIAIGQRTYKAYRELIAGSRYAQVLHAGARVQRLLFGSTGTKDPNASDVLYVEALAAPDTVNTMPEATLEALADHGQIDTVLAADGGDSESVLAQFAQAGIDIDALGVQLQEEGAAKFVRSWHALMESIQAKGAQLERAQ